MSSGSDEKLIGPWSSASSSNDEFKDATDSIHDVDSPSSRRPSSLEIPSLMTNSELLRSSYATASQISSPAKTPSKQSESNRRRKLDSLRRRMVGGVVVTEKNDKDDILLDSGSDYSDAESSEEEENQTIKASDKFVKVAESLPLQSASREQVLVAIPPPPPPGTCAPLLCTTTTKSSSSNGSSKSNTMEHSDNDASKSNSLERGLSLGASYTRSMSGFSSKSNSLTREVSLSGNEVYVTAFESENEFQEYVRRKNSEAAEVINELTCNLVPPTQPSIREESPSEFAESTPTVELQVDTSELSPCASTSTVRLPVFTVSPASTTTSPPKDVGGKNDSAPSVSNGNYQPDIVASNIVKPVKPDSQTEIDQDESESFKEPVPPPRRRRTHHTLSSTVGSVESLPAVFGNNEFAKNMHDMERLNLSANARISHSLSARRAKDPIMEQTPFKNLDTGEIMPLSEASHRVPMDPISFAVLRRMSTVGGRKPNYAESVISSSYQSDSDSIYSSCSGFDSCSIKSMPVKRGLMSTARHKTVEAKRHLGKSVHDAFKKTYTTARSVAGEVSHKIQGGGEPSESEEEEFDRTDQSTLSIRVRSRHQKKGPFDFEQLRQVQDLGSEHTGAVWCLKFSLCGRLLATAGQDNVIRVWVLTSAYAYFNDMRQKYNMEVARKGTASTNLDTLYQLGLQRSTSSNLVMAGLSKNMDDDANLSSTFVDNEVLTYEDAMSPFMPKPFCCYRSHSADVLDIAWSKNYFILSSSMDRTVRLWHASRTECLCCFQHIDFVTCIAFLPKDDRYFVSGSLDAKLRLWHIPDKKVALWNEVEGNKLVTALTFVKNGKFAVAGTFDGRCIFYTTDQLKYHTMIDVRSSRGKNAKGHKVTGLSVFQDKLLVTSNDSRIRLYDLRDLTLTCKYKGATNTKSQIRASFSPDASHIICGSEDRFTYLWRTSIDSSTLSVRKDRNGAWERVRAHNAVVTAAIFAPKPELIFQQVEQAKQSLGLDTARPVVTPTSDVQSSKSTTSRLLSAASSAAGFKSSNKKKNVHGDVVVSADLTGKIYVFLNKTRMKAGASTFFSQ